MDPSDIDTVTGSPTARSRSRKKTPGTPCQSTWPASTADPASPGAGPNWYHATTAASAGMATSPVPASTPAATTRPGMTVAAPPAPGTGRSAGTSAPRGASGVAIEGGGVVVGGGGGAVVVAAAEEATGGAVVAIVAGTSA